MMFLLYLVLEDPVKGGLTLLPSLGVVLIAVVSGV